MGCWVVGLVGGIKKCGVGYHDNDNGGGWEGKRPLPLVNGPSPPPSLAEAEKGKERKEGRSLPHNTSFWVFSPSFRQQTTEQIQLRDLALVNTLLL
ncbi:hypothetical protein Pmani_024008 [Petrolisthes manimaculis]|uniref:Uncharacterized protein n=1 Tax=Petrolisthes manimaculis TaxID=1843537 RepID=A0AAE1PB82_9EUCA|nr:hypothetical protein Pmani_024008 [Petrolisthes manimaculis]